MIPNYFICLILIQKRNHNFQFIKTKKNYSLKIIYMLIYVFNDLTGKL